MAEDAGLEPEVLGIDSPEAMRQTLRSLVAQGARRIAVAGGDGTVKLAAQELAHKDVVLGILPQGTANNFATALRLPQDLPSALRVLLAGEECAVDLGRMGPRYFTESAGVGLFADALTLYGHGTNKDIPRGLYALTRVIFSMQAQRVRLTLDGELHSERAVMCIVANTYRMGYAAPVAPGAKVTDGLLDVVIIGDLRRRELIPYYQAIRAQTHVGLPKVQCLRAREVKIEARRKMNVHCDDQVIGTTPVTIDTAAGALKVLVDPL